jgi:hypothetical protein
MAVGYSPDFLIAPSISVRVVAMESSTPGEHGRLTPQQAPVFAAQDALQVFEDCGRSDAMYGLRPP